MSRFRAGHRLSGSWPPQCFGRSSTDPPRADEPRAFMVGGESTSRGTSAVLDHVAAAAAVAWALGVLIFGGRLLGGWVLARAIARRAEHLANDSVNTTALRLIEELRLGL